MTIKKEQFVIIGIMAVGLLLIGGAVLAYALSQGGTLPTRMTIIATPTPDALALSEEITLEPVESLDEIADKIRPEYPELADLLENPELGSVYKDFYLVYNEGGLPAAMALARQRNILNKNDEIIMTLVLDTEETASLVAELESEGVLISGVYKNLINIAIPISLIEEKAETEDPHEIVERISNLEHVIRLQLPKRATIQQGVTSGQGVDVTLADNWHARGITGRGVKIGVLDLGFAGYEDLLGKELPATVTLKAFGDDYDLYEEAHGTACAEIVHEMAPEAELFLVYYDGTDVAMGQAVEWLIEQEVDIISNSTNSIGTTPLDGTGFSADLVELAYENGIFWVNSAGNYAERHYQGRFEDSDGDNMHDFGDLKKQTISFRAGEDYPTHIVLNWDNWEDVDQDYELILYDRDGNLLAKSEESQSGGFGEQPLEGFLYTFDDEDIYLLGIENYDGTARGDATFDLFIEPSLIPEKFIVREHSLGGPADAEHAFAVGATYWYDDLLEDYSSRGPTTDGRVKPDISAPAGVDSHTYSPENFPGTSAATPHVAGAAALLLQIFPDLMPDDVRAFIQERALDLGRTGSDNQFGAGRINLGDIPDFAEQPDIVDTPVPTKVAEVRATSTPRAANEPSPTFDDPGAGYAEDELTDDEATLLGLIVIVGMCLVCVSVLLFMALIIGGLIMLL
ncbi:S8 family serine peptidase [Anaerolineales bacterium HSG25]|nr:S8 family serine peptidase [Anaerolineales bacterium HSG25]